MSLPLIEPINSTNPTPKLSNSAPKPKELMKFLVIGPNGTGKSSFIYKASTKRFGGVFNGAIVSYDDVDVELREHSGSRDYNTNNMFPKSYKGCIIFYSDNHQKYNRWVIDEATKLSLPFVIINNRARSGSHSLYIFAGHEVCTMSIKEDSVDEPMCLLIDKVREAEKGKGTKVIEPLSLTPPISTPPSPTPPTKTSTLILEDLKFLILGPLDTGKTLFVSRLTNGIINPENGAQVVLNTDYGKQLVYLQEIDTKDISQILSEDEEENEEEVGENKINIHGAIVFYLHDCQDEIQGIINTLNDYNIPLTLVNNRFGPCNGSLVFDFRPITNFNVKSDINITGPIQILLRAYYRNNITIMSMPNGTSPPALASKSVTPSSSSLIPSSVTPTPISFTVPAIFSARSKTDRVETNKDDKKDKENKKDEESEEDNDGENEEESEEDTPRVPTSIISPSIKQVIALKDVLYACSTMANDLYNSVKQDDDAYLKMKDRETILKDKYIGLRNEVTTKHEVIDSLRTKNKELESIISKHSKTKSNQAEIVAELNDRISKLEKQNNELREEDNKLGTLATDLRSQLDQKDVIIKFADVELRTLQRNVADKNEELRTLQRSIEEKNEEIGLLRLSRKEWKEKCIETVGDKNRKDQEHQSEMRDLKERLDDALSTIIKRNESISLAEKRNQVLGKELADVKIVNSNLLEGLKGQAENLRAQAEELKTKNKEIVLKDEQLQMKDEQLRAQAEEITKQAGELKLKDEQVRAQAEELQMKDEGIDRNCTTITSLMDTNQALHKALEKSEEENTKSFSNNKDLKEVNKVLSEYINKGIENKNNISNIELSVDKEKAYATTIFSLRQNVARNEKLIDELSEAITQGNLTIGDLQDQLREQAVEIKLKDEQFNKVKKDHEAAINTYNEVLDQALRNN